MEKQIDQIHKSIELMRAAAENIATEDQYELVEELTDVMYEVGTIIENDYTTEPCRYDALSETISLLETANTIFAQII